MSATTTTTGRRGRPRKGSLEFRGKTWHARLTVTIDGESVRKWLDLGTDNRAVARRKLARLTQEQSGAGTVEQVEADAKREETFGEAAKRIVEQQGRDGLRTWAERLSRVRRYAGPELAHLPIGSIGPAHIRAVLEAARDAGLSKQSVTHLRNDLSGVFGDLWRDEAIRENPVARTAMPKGLKVDRRPRVVLSDAQFAVFMACPDVPEWLAVMALASRAFGGMRTSDLHAWDWSHVDTTSFQVAKVYRPKTQGPDLEQAEAVLETLVIPDVLWSPLEAWWTRWRKPLRGPVFPIVRGEKVERQGKRSHARELRAALWAAGVHQPLDGFEAALASWLAAEGALAAARAEGRKGEIRELQRAAFRLETDAKKLCELQSGSPRYKPVDFHSFRRQFSTALAASGANTASAMALAGHADPRTHMRYVQLAQRGPLEIPAAALPVLPQLGPKLPAANDLPIDDSASFLRRPQRESNPRYRRERRDGYGSPRELPAESVTSSRVAKPGERGETAAWGKTSSRNSSPRWRAVPRLPEMWLPAGVLPQFDRFQLSAAD